MLELRVFDLSHLHVEVSSKCVLKCPRCPRTELKEYHPQINREYSLEEFQNIFTQDVLLKIKYLNFCGDIGDPIYATDFLQIVQYIKLESPGTQISIVTNGSYKKPSWWQELGLYLNENDRVTFSVDGWDHNSNNIYRVNSDWDSIIAGIKTLKEHSVVNLKWSSILFRFNMHRIDDIKQLATDLGVDEVAVVHSMKFGGNDPRYLNEQGVDLLEPDYGTEDRVYSRSVVTTGRQFRFPATEKKICLPQACLNGRQMPFVSVDGRFFPCAWFGSGYIKNDFLDQYQHRINIRERSLDEVLNDSCWEELKMRWQISPPAICKFKCTNNGK
jgi:MoaA/NifB/PqqE/SkfB family radical SAM enzyme